MLDTHQKALHLARHCAAVVCPDCLHRRALHIGDVTVCAAVLGDVTVCAAACAAHGVTQPCDAITPTIPPIPIPYSPFNFFFWGGGEGGDLYQRLPSPSELLKALREECVIQSYPGNTRD
jgi:hypothetical protein